MDFRWLSEVVEPSPYEREARREKRKAVGKKAVGRLPGKEEEDWLVSKFRALVACMHAEKT